MSSRGLPAIEAAVRSRIFVQRYRCSSVAVHGLWDTLSRESDTVSASVLCALRRLRQPGAAANLAGESCGNDVSAGTVVETAGHALRAMPA